jgi:hypothetical protein
MVVLGVKHFQLLQAEMVLVDLVQEVKVASVAEVVLSVDAEAEAVIPAVLVEMDLHVVPEVEAEVHITKVRLKSMKQAFVQETDKS